MGKIKEINNKDNKEKNSNVSKSNAVNSKVNKNSIDNASNQKKDNVIKNAYTEKKDKSTKSISKNRNTKKINTKKKKKFLFFDGKKKSKKKNYRKKKGKLCNGKFNLDILDIMIIVVITAIVSCVMTGFILNYQYRKNSLLYGDDTEYSENVEEFLKTYSEIIDNFYEEIDEDAMMKAAMEGMLNFLEDNYSIYMDASSSEGLSEMLDGTYEGLGIVLVSNEINDVYDDSPADEAGMKKGDIITEINGNGVTSDNYDEISSFLDYENENTIVVTRDGKSLTFKVSVGTVSVPATTTDVITSVDGKTKIGYISLNAFSNLAFEDFKDALEELEDNKGIDNLIIDLRNNSGGYLTVASSIASLFLKKGDVIYSLESKNVITTEKDENDVERNYDIVVLVNSNTASAAEILACALHDSYGAVVVGKTTYGKGKVQTMKYYEDTILKYTSAKWLRPNGECIDEIGLVPDYDVDLKYDDDTIYDTQLDKAIELLS